MLGAQPSAPDAALHFDSAMYMYDIYLYIYSCAHIMYIVLYVHMQYIICANIMDKCKIIHNTYILYMCMYVSKCEKYTKV